MGFLFSDAHKDPTIKRFFPRPMNDITCTFIIKCVEYILVHLLPPNKLVKMAQKHLYTFALIINYMNMHYMHIKKK